MQVRSVIISISEKYSKYYKLKRPDMNYISSKIKQRGSEEGIEREKLTIIKNPLMNGMAIEEIKKVAGGTEEINREKNNGNE